MFLVSALLAKPPLKLFTHFLRLFDNCLVQAGHEGHVETIGGGALALSEFVEKVYFGFFVWVFSAGHMIARHALYTSEFLNQLMIVRRKKTATFNPGCQVLQNRVSNTKTVISGGPSTQFVHNGQRPLCSKLKQALGLLHLDEKGRLSFQYPVRGTDTREDPVDRCQHRALSWHVTPDLRQNDSQACLPEQSRFATHVRSGHQEGHSWLFRATHPRRVRYQQ